MKLVVGTDGSRLYTAIPSGQEHHAERLPGKNVVLVFFPMAWTPV
jgi:peroxiredoxin